ncbi:hypothetical protein MY3296_006747 [Beauveria thailandica]
MSLYTDADGTESNLTTDLTQDGLLTPNTEYEENLSIRVWLELQQAVKLNHTHDPTPGDILIIIDKSYPRVLACHPGGHLILDNIAEYDMREPIPKRWKWLCTETDGFIGFRSLAENKFLGRDIWWNFAARATVQKGYENFILIKRQFGYRVQSPFWFGFKPLSARSDGSGIEAKQPEAPGISSASLVWTSIHTKTARLEGALIGRWWIKVDFLVCCWIRQASAARFVAARDPAQRQWQALKIDAATTATYTNPTWRLENSYTLRNTMPMLVNCMYRMARDTYGHRSSIIVVSFTMIAGVTMQFTTKAASLFNQFVNPIGMDSLGWKYYLVYKQRATLEKIQEAIPGESFAGGEDACEKKRLRGDRCTLSVQIPQDIIFDNTVIETQFS